MRTTFPESPNVLHYRDLPEVNDGRYTVRLARDRKEVEAALRLRHDVFNVELAGHRAEAGLEFDTYDFKCLHLIVITNTGETVGTYRLNTIETALSVHGFYSANEFTIEDLPCEVLEQGVEIGRACIARNHRNTKVLFLLWKGLLGFLKHSKKRYYFGCCSIFTSDRSVGRAAFQKIVQDGYLDEKMSVVPCRNALSFASDDVGRERLELPPLFNMYLRIGARVCGPPMIDREFGTIDFFVVFDLTQMSSKFRRIFC